MHDPHLSATGLPDHTPVSAAPAADPAAAVCLSADEVDLPQARNYTRQRERYGAGLQQLGLELFTGDGGFYHWAKLPDGLTGDAFNERLMRHEAAILPGRLCDMARRGDRGPLGDMVRFSFGPLLAESFDGDMAILAKCL
jgi:aspartate/methionine/tyrosine aminotransferase